MNANSKLPAQTIKQWLDEATQKLQVAGIPSARLDSELLLADAIGRDRVWLITHLEEPLEAASFAEGFAFPAKRGKKNGQFAPSEPEENDVDLRERVTRLLDRRANREPLAYIRGYKEFYGRNFLVTPDTLIPRPETEVMIELLAPLVATDQHLIDIGTGSGVIAITAALEFPDLIVDACDVSSAALIVAEKNAAMHDARVSFSASNLLDSIDTSYHIICANLPYVDSSWNTSAETRLEPSLALYASDGGLALINRLIEQAPSKLAATGYLLLEADPRQHDAIIQFAHGHGFDWHQTDGYIIVLQKR